jgi:aspartyl/asparaginyl beta-hydroxylase (cupin superfamily)
MVTFYEKGLFTFSKILEDSYEGILADYLKIQEHQKMKWPEADLHNDKWKVFGLFDYPNGKKIEENCNICKFTSELIETHIPHHRTAGYSIMTGNTIINPHEGHQDANYNVLRLHLGLIIPSGDIALRIGNEIKSWEVGKVSIFDDTVNHEAWNKTDQDRVVLLLDFNK